MFKDKSKVIYTSAMSDVILKKRRPSSIRAHSWFKKRNHSLCLTALGQDYGTAFSVLLLTFIIINLFISNSCAVPPQEHAASRHYGVGQRRHSGGHRRSSPHPQTYLNQFAVKLYSDDDEKAANIAAKYGFVFKGKIGNLERWYMFEDKRIYKRSLGALRHHLSSHRLKKDHFVNIVEQQKVLIRKKRDKASVSSYNRNVPNDPAWSRMWYMHCGGAYNNICPTSMRISDAWRSGYSGKNVVVTILDDGLETNHPDLRVNYDANASYDINGMDVDPTPRYEHSNENKHGTRCAGVVAAVSGNHICSVGIAYNARIGGVRMLDGEVTDNVEARSLGHNPQHIDIYSASWGPDDDGNTAEGPGYLAKDAFKDGARRGRGGKGSIYVWASGNGGHNKDTCSCDGYINSIYTIGISSVSQNGKRPWYLESCASTLATTYSSGEVDEGKIITTDLRGSCTYAHTGTSASAPMAAGVIALMLDANKNLTWRDVQHVIVRTSNPYGLQAKDWVVNGAGYNVSHVFGFGLLDAARLTHVAHKWKTVPEQKLCPVNPNHVAEEIVANHPLYLTVETRACHEKANEINFLEHVILRISLTHPRRGDLQIFLTSPDGTKSNILERRTLDRSNAGFDEWDFMTTHHWGENPRGHWTLEIYDKPFRYRDPNFVSELLSWQLIFYGTRENPQPNFYYNSCDAFPQDQCHKQCDGCCGPTEMECRSCRNVSTFTGTCITSCPSGHFPHPRTKICQACWRTCSECSAAFETNCTKCRGGHSLLNGRCIKKCTAGYFLHQASQRCLMCSRLCRTCEGRSERCTSCRQGFNFQRNTCEPSCPSNTFLLSYREGCQLCISPCLECTSYSHCTACRPGTVLHHQRCEPKCPKKYYLDTNQHTCKSCHESCKTCRGPNANDCTACSSEYGLQNGRCSRLCRDDYEGNYRSNPCLLIIKMKFCAYKFFHSMCCHTCTLYESGNLFVAPDDYSDLDDYAYGDANYTDDDQSYSFSFDDDYTGENNVIGHIEQIEPEYHDLNNGPFEEADSGTDGQHAIDLNDQERGGSPSGQITEEENDQNTESIIRRDDSTSPLSDESHSTQHRRPQKHRKHKHSGNRGQGD